MVKSYSKFALAFLGAIFAASHCACNSSDEPPKDGPYVEYYDSGKKKLEGHFKDGKQVGLWPMWYENGQKEAEGHWKGGKRDGLWTWWHANGQKSEEGHFKDGKYEGLWTKWYENSQKESVVHYNNGKLVSASVWKPDGKPGPITKIVDGSGIVVDYFGNG